MSTNAVTPFQLLQWRGAVKIESRGMRVTRGRKVTPHVKRFFGLKRNASTELVLEHIEAAIAAVKEAGVPLTQPVEFTAQ